MATSAVVVLAAGKGTRLKSRRPKVLHEICGAPLVTYPVRAARSAGVDEVVVVVGHGAEAVEEAVRTLEPDARFALQAEQRGTGHAAMVGLEAVGTVDRVVILSGDAPLLTAETLKALRAASAGKKAGILTTRLEDPSGYGRVVRGPDGAPARIVEHRDASAAELQIEEINAGIYDFDAGFLRQAVAELSADNDQGELYLTDVLAAAGGDAIALCIDDPSEALGANTRRELADLERRMCARAVRALEEQGVTVLDPNTTRVAPDVEVGPDTVLHSGVHLRGRTRIGASCTIDVGSVLEDAVVEEGAVVHPYSVIQGARVESGASIGPFARLREGADVGKGAKVGNFVEIKKTRLDDGAKVNHLTYLGNATVGAKSNVGAGTITCNYDGFGKHPTRIGAGAFIGSNSTLVAPVDLGDGAYVGAGSVMTESAPADALVLGRARQVTKPGRAADVRAKARARAKGDLQSDR